MAAIKCVLIVAACLAGQAIADDAATKAQTKETVQPKDTTPAKEKTAPAPAPAPAKETAKKPEVYESNHGFLNSKDEVAISFWIVSIAMIAATVFFLWEGLFIGYHWKTSMNVGALVTLIAAVHYLYMREYWVTLHESPIVYRYIDWSLTVPLQMVEFYLILQAVKPDLGAGMFFRLLVGTVVMILFGYLGESEILPPVVGFIVGMCGWGFILFEIFAGEGGQVAANAKEMPEAVQSAFNLMRFIVTAGWCIYPAGYAFGFLMGAIQDAPLNLIYNLADFVNKIWFCLAIWAAAKQETQRKVLAKEGGHPLLG